MTELINHDDGFDIILTKDVNLYIGFRKGTVLRAHKVGYLSSTAVCVWHNNEECTILGDEYRILSPLERLALAVE